MALLRSANMTLPLQIVAHVRDETVRLSNLMELQYVACHPPLSHLLLPAKHLVAFMNQTCWYV
jgi:hypothetical protein